MYDPLCGILYGWIIKAEVYKIISVGFYIMAG